MSKEFRELVGSYFRLPINVDTWELFLPHWEREYEDGGKTVIWIDDENEVSTVPNKLDNIQKSWDLHNQPILVNSQTQHKETRVVIVKRNNNLVISSPNKLLFNTYGSNEEVKASNLYQNETINLAGNDLSASNPNKKQNLHSAIKTKEKPNNQMIKNIEELSDVKTLREKLKGHLYSTVHCYNKATKKEWIKYLLATTKDEVNNLLRHGTSLITSKFTQEKDHMYVCTVIKLSLKMEISQSIKSFMKKVKSSKQAMKWKRIISFR